MKKIIVTLIFSFISLSAYDIEKEGRWWYIYDGNDVLGAFVKKKYVDKYMGGCGDPNKSKYEKTYVDSSDSILNKNYNTKREIQNLIIKYCKKK